MTDYDRLWDAAWSEAAVRGPGFRSRYAVLLDRMGRHGVTGRLLEVGAGGGFFLERAARRFPWLELHAHEQSGRAIERLRTLAVLRGVHEGSLDGPPPWGEASFHHIVCSEVLEHLDDPEGALDKMVAALRPGGRLFLTVPMFQDAWTVVDTAVGHRRRYAPGELAEAVRRRGLDVEADEQWGFPFYNTYYRALGSRPPEDQANKHRGPAAAILSAALGALFTAEAQWPSRRGLRGLVVARHPIAPGLRGR